MSTSFKSLLEQILESNNLSISKLSSIIDVDRTWLQHALAGRRNLGYDNLEKIINSLELTELQNENLREAFAIEYFGTKDYEVIKTSLNRIREMHRFEESINTKNYIKDFSSICSNITKKYSTNTKQNSFYTNLYKIVEDELDRNLPTFYTNYCILQDSLRSLFLNILSTQERYISYNHIIYNEQTCNDQDIIDCYLYQSEFAGYGYNTYSINNENIAKININIFPYYLATSKSYILFSKDLECFIIGSDEPVISYIKNKYYEHINLAEPFTHFMRNNSDFSLFVSLLNYLSSSNNEYAYDLSENLCMANYLDSDILKDAIPDSIELKEFFIHGICEFYNSTSQIPTISLFSTESLLNFITNDLPIADYHNVAFDILQISPQNKLYMLKKLLASSNNEHNSYYILNTNKLRFPSYFHNYMYGNLTLGFNYKIYDSNDNNKYIGVCYKINPVISKHLKNISEYIIHSTNTYSNSKECAITHINSSISYYSNKHNLT